MGMRIHELHPSLIHAPLTLLPAASLVDLWAASRRDLRLGHFGRGLWVAGAATGLFAGLAGMAASQEVDLDHKPSADVVYLHGMLNLTILGAATGAMFWRRSHRPTVVSGALGLAACGLALWSAYLGGEAVYGQGVGIKAIADQPKTDASPPLFSREAPRILLADAARGFRWLMRRTWALLRRQDALDRQAVLRSPVDDDFRDEDRDDGP
ncbi:MAG TPA: DUF2231 domain-containing protein, partial [Longimicrobium sp.]|nr:DUF2231 domain-containing protein [Longimicrobium sp.]